MTPIRVRVSDTAMSVTLWASNLMLVQPGALMGVQVCAPILSLLRCDPAEKREHTFGNLRQFLLQREVTGIKYVQLGVGHVTQVRARPLDGEEGIVRTPHNQRPWPRLAQPRLPLRVALHSRVALQREVASYLLPAGQVQEVLV